jgi:redox-sensing transcriptional repressor
MRQRKVPEETIRRLPVYLRGLMSLSQNGCESISSSDLADLLGFNSWQIRKDFSFFGDFGTPGVGYNVKSLSKQIKKILKLNETRRAALIGVGNLGSALLMYGGFGAYGLEIVAAFDEDTNKVGEKVNGIAIESIDDVSTLIERGIYLAIIAVPGDAAQTTAEALVDSGIKGILNFAPCKIKVPKKVKIITIDIGLDLARLPYYMSAG